MDKHTQIIMDWLAHGAKSAEQTVIDIMKRCNHCCDCTGGDLCMDLHFKYYEIKNYCNMHKLIREADAKK